MVDEGDQKGEDQEVGWTVLPGGILEEKLQGRGLPGQGDAELVQQQHQVVFQYGRGGPRRESAEEGDEGPQDRLVAEERLVGLADQHLKQLQLFHLGLGKREKDH